jgi:molybdopterin-guanine dinucleotide biosynthesis protein A
MDAVVLAGGHEGPDDPLYALCGDKPKSLLKIAGKPMVQWTLDALSQSRSIDHVVLIGLEGQTGFTCKKPLTILPDKGTLIENIVQGASFLQTLHPQQTHMITLSADIPAVTTDIVDQMIETFNQYDVDICYSVVSREVMEKRFPESKRTYIKFKDVEVCGGDLNYLRKETALNPQGLWNELIRTRKNPLRQAAIIGFGTLLLILTKQIDLEATVGRVCRRLGIKGKAIRSPFAELGMDVDKPFQFEMVERDLLR